MARAQAGAVDREAKGLRRALRRARGWAVVSRKGRLLRARLEVAPDLGVAADPGAIFACIVLDVPGRVVVAGGVARRRACVTREYFPERPRDNSLGAAPLPVAGDAGIFCHPGTAQVAVGLFPRLAVAALAAGLRLRTRAELRVLPRFSAVRVAVAVVLGALSVADGAREAGRVDGAVDAGCRLQEPPRPVCVCRRDESREGTESEHLFDERRLRGHGLDLPKNGKSVYPRYLLRSQEFHGKKA